MKRAAVIGLGPTHKFFKPELFDFSITVNDGLRNHKCDYLVCVDHPYRFSEDRLKYIMNSETMGFFTHVKGYESVMNYHHIRLKRGSDLDSMYYDSSTNSTYVAAVAAYKLGAREIITYGVDFTQDHKFFRHKNVRIKAVQDWGRLKERMKEKGCNLYCSDSFSRLSEVLPVKKLRK